MEHKESYDVKQALHEDFIYKITSKYQSLDLSSFSIADLDIMKQRMEKAAANYLSGGHMFNRKTSDEEYREYIIKCGFIEREINKRIHNTFNVK